MRDNIIQIRNSSICYYQRVDSNKRKKIELANNLKDSKDTRFKSGEHANKSYTGQVNKSSQKKIKAAIDILLQVVDSRKVYNTYTMYSHDFRLAFITLTLPYNERFVPAAEANKILLQPFLDWIRKTKNINTYIWKAERQSPKDIYNNIKNSKGQLHYHFTIPNFINLQELREKWNSICKSRGYVNNEHLNNLKDYDPNSTDIHSVYNLKDLEAYLIKYVSKMSYSHICNNGIYTELEKSAKGNYIIPSKVAEGSYLCYMIEIDNELVEVDMSIEGKVWDCSTNLKGVKYYNIIGNDYNYKKYRELKDVKGREVFTKDYAEVVRVKGGDVFSFLDNEQWIGYMAWKDSIRKTISFV